MPYEYRVIQILKVVDGDTVDCTIDLGFGMRGSFRFRLLGVDTPETRGAEASQAGKEATEFTRNWVTGRKLLVRTAKGHDTTVGIGDGHFGRWLAEFVDATNDEHLTAALIDAGYGG